MARLWSCRYSLPLCLSLCLSLSLSLSLSLCVCVCVCKAVVAQGDVCAGADASMFVVVEGLLTAWIETTPGGVEVDVVSILYIR